LKDKNNRPLENQRQMIGPF